MTTDCMNASGGIDGESKKKKIRISQRDEGRSQERIFRLDFTIEVQQGKSRYAEK